MKKSLLFILTLFSISSFAKPGYLGIVIQSYKTESVLGVKVADVITNGAADISGLLRDDVITTINNVQVLTKEEMLAEIGKYSLGDKVVVSFIRDGKRMEKNVELGNAPVQVKVALTKDEKNQSENWKFEDDENTIVIQKNFGKTVSVNYAGKSVSQNDVNLNERIEFIQRVSSNVNVCNCVCNTTQYTFYKIEKPEVKEKEDAFVVLAETFKITPNPSGGLVQILISSKAQGTAVLTLYDINGEVVLSDMLQNFEGVYSKNYALNHLPKGPYVVQLKIGELQTSKKLILQ